MYSQQQLLAGNTAGGLRPNQIGSSLVLWFDAQVKGTLYQDSAATTPVAANSDPVGFWGDKGRLAANVTQATAGKRPVYNTAGINNRPALKFTAASTQWLAGSVFNGMQSASGEVWGVIKSANGNGPTGTLWSISKPSSASDVAEFFYINTATGVYREDTSIFGQTTANEMRSPTGLADATPYITRFGSASGAYFIERNGVLQSLTAQQGSNNGLWTDRPSSPTVQTVGASQFSGGQSVLADFFVGELMVFNAPLTTAQANGIRKYLKKRWGINF